MADVETFDVELSTGRKVTLKELNGLEQIKADSCAPESAPMAAVYYRTVMAVVAIDGEPVGAAVGAAELNARLARLRGRESDELVKAYFQHVNAERDNLPKA